MNIALAHFRIGSTDGVSLEMEKWRLVLEKMGYQVLYISGDYESDISIPELGYMDEKNLGFVRNCYEEMNCSAQELKDSILRQAHRISDRLKSTIDTYSIDVIIPNNIWSLGWNLPAAIGFADAVKACGIRAIGHHHDFFWERERYSRPTCPFVAKALSENLPPASPSIRHAVINRIAEAELLHRRGIPSTVVPNVFDFDQTPWVQDDYNAALRAEIGAAASDIVVLQATRVTERKAIELAIELVGLFEERRHELKGPLYDGRVFDEESRIILLLPGLIECQGKYLEFLTQLAEENGVKLVWCSHLIGASRGQRNGTRQFSLWDAYAISDIITYPSILEGWGNQFLEAVFARKPVVVYEYPVFISDIRDKGFEIISLGSTHTLRDNGYAALSETTLNEAVTAGIRYLKDAQARTKAVERNFALGQKHYSLTALEDILSRLLAPMEEQSTGTPPP